MEKEGAGSLVRVLEWFVRRGMLEELQVDRPIEWEKAGSRYARVRID